MKRRTLLLAAGAVLPASRASAAPRRIGWLSPFAPDFAQLLVDSVTARLRGLGHIAGRDIEIHTRFANRDYEKLPQLARELVALDPALIVSTNNNSTQHLMRATKTIPIVMAGALSPVQVGLVNSLARPGGNVTGTTNNQPEIAGKMLEVLRAAAPRLVRVTTVWNSQVPGMLQYQQPLERTARRLGITPSYVDIHRAEDFSMEALVATRPDGVIVTYDTAVAAHADAIVRAAREHKWLTLGVLKPFVQEGGLLALYPDSAEFEQNVAEIIDQILRGKKVADIPVRDPSRFQLTVSNATARALGITLPRELLLQANEVIE
jgi:putative ABC transport system substrate-binding protein